MGAAVVLCGELGCHRFQRLQLYTVIRRGTMVHDEKRFHCAFLCPFVLFFVFYFSLHLCRLFSPSRPPSTIWRFVRSRKQYPSYRRSARSSSRSRPSRLHLKFVSRMPKSPLQVIYITLRISRRRRAVSSSARHLILTLLTRLRSLMSVWHPIQNKECTNTGIG